MPEDHPESEKISATNTELYNGMIYPFTRMVITGALWYQGKCLFKRFFFILNSS